MRLWATRTGKLSSSKVLWQTYLLFNNMTFRSIRSVSKDIVGLKSLTCTSNLMCCIGQHNTRTYRCEVFVNFLGDLISSCYKTQCTLKIFESAETACTCKKVVTPNLTLYISIQKIKTKQRPVIMENITLSSLRVKHHSWYIKKNRSV